MSTHNICFRQEIRKILCGYPLLSVADIMGVSFVLFLAGTKYYLESTMKYHTINVLISFLLILYI